MNDKIKALWMAQYLGQTVLYTIGDRIEILSPHYLNEIYKPDTKNNCLLLLRTVDMLTNEEIEAIGLHIGWGISEQNKTTVFPWIINDLSGNIQNAFYKEIFRCYGIITSFTYLSEDNQPVTLTPAEIIKLGWAKIKQTL